MQMCSKGWVVTRGIFYSAVVAEKTLSMPQGFFLKYCCCFVSFLVMAVYSQPELGFIS